MNHLPKKKNSCHLNHYGLLNVQPVPPLSRHLPADGCTHNASLPTTKRLTNQRRRGGGGGILALQKRRRRAKQNFGKIFGEYSSLSEMITNVHGGQKSDLVEKILHKQMQRLL